MSLLHQLRSVAFMTVTLLFSFMTVTLLFSFQQRRANKLHDCRKAHYLLSAQHLLVSHQYSEGRLSHGGARNDTYRAEGSAYVAH